MVNVAEDITDEQLEDQLVDFVAECYDDPLKFVMQAFLWGEDELKGFDGPDKWQKDFLIDIGKQVKQHQFDGVTATKAIRMATASGHGIGKSALTAWLILWIMSTRPYAKGIVTANTSEQLRTKTWGELGKWKKRCATGHWFTYNDGKGNMNLYHPDHSESWRCDAQTCREENSEAFAGLHAANSTPFYIFDEASAIPEKINEVAEGGLTDGEPMFFKFGNPTRNSGSFFQAFHRLKHRWFRKQIDSRTAKLPNKELIKEWIEDYGEDSDFVRVRVLGKFPRSGSLQFISNELVQNAQSRKPTSDRHAPGRIGVDVARFGDDQSVLIYRRGRDAQTIPVKKFRELDTMQLSAQVIQFKNELTEMGLNVDAIFVDGNGIGGGVVDRLRQLGFEVIEVQLGNKAVDSKKYANRRAECWGRMKAWLKGGCISDDIELETDLTGLEYGFNVREQIQLEKKEDMKKRGLASPDVADALSLTFAEDVEKTNQAYGPETQHFANNDFDPTED